MNQNNYRPPPGANGAYVNTLFPNLSLTKELLPSLPPTMMSLLGYRGNIKHYIITPINFSLTILGLSEKPIATYPPVEEPETVKVTSSPLTDQIADHCPKLIPPEHIVTIRITSSNVYSSLIQTANSRSNKIIKGND